jgi:predicted helicase
MSQLLINDYLKSRTFDGFRKTVAQEFSDIYVVDLGGDVRANPKLSGTKNNVFGIQTGVAISFFIMKTNALSPAPLPPVGEGRAQRRERVARIYYNRRPELETAEEKLSFLANHSMRHLAFEQVQPDKNHNWVNLTDNDFDTLLPLASKDTKAAKTAGKERAIFKLYSLGAVTNRDEWVYDYDKTVLQNKVSFLIDTYNSDLKRLGSQLESEALDDMLNYSIKWTRAVKAQLRRRQKLKFDSKNIRKSLYRPFVSSNIYFDKLVNEFQYQTPLIWPDSDSNNPAICFTTGGRLPFSAFSTDIVPCLTVLSLDANQCLGLYRYDEAGNRADNITDWALKQFQQHYKTPSPLAPLPQAGEGNKAAKLTKRGAVSLPRPLVGEGWGEGRSITKQAIFHYCYAVLHDPLYREKYALNLKREFPRIPFYADFWQWAAWGEALLALHIGYESVAPYALKRIDIADEKARAAGKSSPQSSPASERGGEREKLSSILAPKAILRADKDVGSITLDSETTLRDIPPAAWHYKLGNRCALEWILDQYKEKKPKDPTICEKFDTYRFADYKENVIDLLARVTTVSVETERITEAMKAAVR